MDLLELVPVMICSLKYIIQPLAVSLCFLEIQPGCGPRKTGETKMELKLYGSLFVTVVAIMVMFKNYCYSIYYKSGCIPGDLSQNPRLDLKHSVYKSLWVVRYRNFHKNMNSQLVGSPLTL